MNTIIAELVSGLQAQQEKLADDIRSAESALITTKEGYLKVQGALEILDILKTRVSESSEKEEDDLENLELATA